MKKYINSISALQIFQLLRYSTFIIIGIVFTKTSLSQPEIGKYETFLFLGGAISFFWLNGLLKSLLPLANHKNGSPIFSAFVLIQGFSLLTVILLFLLQPFFSDFFLHGNELPQIKLLLLFVVFSAPASLVEYVYLIKEKNKALLIFGIVFFLLQFILVVSPVLFGLGIEKSLMGLVISFALKYLWLWICFIYFKELTVSTKFIKEHLKLGVPLIAATLLSGSAQYVDGFIVTSRFDEAAFAVFRYGARELPLVLILANALSNAMLPRFAGTSNLAETLSDLKRSTLRLMKFLFPVTLVFLLVSYPLFPRVFNADFSASATIFNIYLLLITSRLLFPQTILNGLKIGTPIMLASFFELTINIALSLVFVNFWGLAGIAYATVIAYIFEKIFLVVIVKRKLNISISQYVPFRLYLLFSLLVIIVFIFAELVIKDYGLFIG